MQIDHVGMYVADLEKAKTFFIKYFDVTVNEKYNNSKTHLETYFLSFQDGARLEIMTKPDVINKYSSGLEIGYHHLAIGMKTKKDVDRLTNKLRADGYQIISGPRTTGDGYYETLFKYEQHLIELIAVKS